MNHLLAVEKVREILNGKGDDYTISHWQRLVRHSDKPEAVLNKLKKAVKAANEFNEWVSTHSDFYTRNMSWHISAISSKLLFWGFAPEELTESKAEFSADFDSEVERVRKLYS